MTNRKGPHRVLFLLFIFARDQPRMHRLLPRGPEAPRDMAGASLKEIITKDHVKSGRSNIYDELRAWPTTVRFT